MRHAIFEIFKALRHFGVTADEIDSIAKAYKFWSNHPVDSVQIYSNVYYHRGVLYAMPYPIEELKNAFVGIELDRTIYLAGYQCNVCQDKLAESLMWLKGKIFNKFSPEVHYGVEVPNNINLELPTAAEVRTLIKETSNDAKLNCVVFNRISCYWTKPAKKCLEKPLIISSWYGDDAPHCPAENEEAHVQPVIHPRTGIDFVGKINRYGIPDRKTEKVYCELLANVKH